MEALCLPSTQLALRARREAERAARDEPPLAAAGYTNLRCLGGGYAIYEHRRVLLSGESCRFGQVDPEAAAALLRHHFGSQLTVEVEADVRDLVEA